MSDWTAEELDKIGAADELEIAALRPDGTLRPSTTIWVVRVGDDLYVRSQRGRSGAWFRSVLRRPQGRIRAGGVTRDVAFQEPDGADHDAIDPGDDPGDDVIQRGSYELAVTTVESPEQRIGVRVGSGPRFEMFVYMDDVDETLAAAARRCDRRH